MRKFPRRSASVLLCLLLTVLVGCSAPRVRSQDQLRVVASFAPVYAIALALTDGVAGIHLEVMAGSSTGCLHDYTLTAADMKRVENADLYLIGGAGMEGAFLDKLRTEYPRLPIADASAGIPLLPAASGDRAPGEHGDEAARENRGEPEDVNPHIWLSTANAAIMAENLATALCAAAPGEAARIRTNLSAFQAGLAGLYDAYRPQFDPLTRRGVITFHEAFSYLAEELGLDVVQVIETEAGTAPDPRTLEALIQAAQTGRAAAIFTEPQYPDATAGIIAAETGIGVYTLDPIVTGEMDAGSFLSRLEADLETLLTVLQSA